MISEVVSLGETGRRMCEGEFESLKAIYAVSPGFVPKPYAWGRYKQESPETYFLLAEFREIRRQVCQTFFTSLRTSSDSRKETRFSEERDKGGREKGNKQKFLILASYELVHRT